MVAYDYSGVSRINLKMQGFQWEKERRKESPDIAINTSESDGEYATSETSADDWGVLNGVKVLDLQPSWQCNICMAECECITVHTLAGG